MFAGNDEMAFGAVKAARAHGLSVPEDLSMVGFDDQTTALAFRDQLRGLGVAAKCTADYEPDRFGRGDSCQTRRPPSRRIDPTPKPGAPYVTSLRLNGHPLR